MLGEGTKNKDKAKPYILSAWSVRVQLDDSRIMKTMIKVSSIKKGNQIQAQ